MLVALPLLLAAFTVARPQPLPAPTLPPAFDTPTAEQLARELNRKYPDRSPGSAGSLGATSWVTDQFELYDFKPRADSFSARIPGLGQVRLQNLVVVVRGASQRTIVITAHRDNGGQGRGANDNASGTAALIELARPYAPSTGAGVDPPSPSHTLVFVSTDGGAFGALGAARFLQTSPYRNNADAVINLDAIGGRGSPRLLIAGDTARSPAASLVRTAATRILEQSGRMNRRARPHCGSCSTSASPSRSVSRGRSSLAGVPAVTLTTVPDAPAAGFLGDDLSVERLGELGRAAQNLVGSLDAGLELAQGTTSYVYLGTRIVRGWAIALVVLAALLPFAIGAIDLFARCRRRRIPLGAAALSLRHRLLFWGFAGTLVFVAGKLGALPEGEPRPLPPDAGVYTPSPVVLGVLAAALLAGWLVGRERLLPRRPATAEETLAGHTVALLALGLLALVVVVTNPFSLIYLLPSLYAWLWLPQAYEAPPVVRGGLLLLGFTGPLILLLSFGTRFDLGLETPWYLLTLVTVGYVPWLAVGLAVVWCAAAAQLTALTAGRYAAFSNVRVRGPRPPLRLARREAAEKREALEG